MEKMSDTQKERIQALEEQADRLLEQCQVLTLASVNEQGYPRICTMLKAMAPDFRTIYFVTSKRSAKDGKAAHFERNPKASVCYQLGTDSVTLLGVVEFVTDRTLQEQVWKETDRRFFRRGVEDPKFRLLRFHTLEATFWIGGKFKTVKYE